MQNWIDKWMEMGFIHYRAKKRTPLRSHVAWFLYYNLGW
jgi:hypothetical protein